MSKTTGSASVIQIQPQQELRGTTYKESGLLQTLCQPAGGHDIPLGQPCACVFPLLLAMQSRSYSSALSLGQVDGLIGASLEIQRTAGPLVILGNLDRGTSKP